MWDIHAIYGDFLMNNQRFKKAVHMYKKVYLNLAEIPFEHRLLNSNISIKLTVSIAICQ